MFLRVCGGDAVVSESQGKTILESRFLQVLETRKAPRLEWLDFVAHRVTGRGEGLVNCRMQEVDDTAGQREAMNIRGKAVCCYHCWNFNS